LLRRPQNPLWSFSARRIGGPGILGLEGRDVEPFDADTVKFIRNWYRGKLRRGRPRAGYHREWASRFQELYAEALEEYELNRVDGEARPSKTGSCQLIAEDDFAIHPERFKSDPAGRLRNDAGRTVWKAVKPLI
jgi:hypothetical protein